MKISYQVQSVKVNDWFYKNINFQKILIKTLKVCTVVLGFAQTLLENNASETEIMQFIKQNFCSNLGPLNQMCSQYIDENGRHILYVLGQDLVKETFNNIL